MATEGFKVTPPSTEGLPAMSYEFHAYRTMERLRDAAEKNDEGAYLSILNNWRSELEGIGVDDPYRDEIAEIDRAIDNAFNSLKEEWELRNKNREMLSSVARALRLDLQRQFVFRIYKAVIGLAKRKGLIPTDVTYVKWDLRKELEDQITNAISLREDREKVRGVIRGYPNPFRSQNKATNLGRK